MQNVRVFVSSVLSNTWVVRSDSCVNSQATCKEDRGRTFDPSASTSWKQLGDYDVGINQNIGPHVQGILGNETLTLGLQGSGGPVLHNQGVVAYSQPDLNLGMFGANALATNSSGKSQGPPSYLVSLKNQSMIPSLSFGYTAGNQYRLKKVYGSLTLGGYDSSLFRPNTLAFPFTGNDPAKYMQVKIQSITAKDQAGKVSPLLPNPIFANVDSTESMIWLPAEACKAFESTFGLVYDQKTGLYLVDDDLHTKLQEQNASVSFTLSSGGTSADIILPYDSFDLLVKPPFLNIASQQRYFPLRRAVNDSQYTLGRTFFQEAYLTVDWDRRNFSLSQCNFTGSPKPNLVSIYSPGEAPASGLSSGVKIGIGIGIAVGVVVIVAVVCFFIFRRRLARHRAAEEALKSGINPKEGLIRHGFAKGEMGAGIENARFEMEGSDGNALKPYGGQTPPWVDEKARYPGLGFPDVVEIDGAGQRAELGGAVGFYGGRGVHEMYDPSSVPPIELPTSSSDTPSRHGELEGSSTAMLSTTSPRSKTSSSSKPSPVRSSLFGAFTRRSRAQSGVTEKSSSGVSGPSAPSSPKHAERAFGSRGKAHLISIHRQSDRSIATSHRRQTPRSQEMIPPVPSRDHDSYGAARSTHRSGATGLSAPTDYGDPNAPSTYSIPSAPSSARLPDRGTGSFGRMYHSQRSAERSSGPSAPSSPSSPYSPTGRRQRHGSQVSAPSSGNGNNPFSPITRRPTNDILSPISPEDDSDHARREEYFGGFSRFR